MTDGATVVFLPSRLLFFRWIFLKFSFDKPCLDNYEHSKKRVSQIGRVLSDISCFKVSLYV